jgi:hypothetical protein
MTLLRHLRHGWRRLSEFEQSDQITELLKQGCTLRGLAKDLRKRPTTIRRRATLAQLSDNEKERIRNGSSIKAVLAEFQERRRLELLAKRLATLEDRQARILEVASLILNFVKKEGIGPGYFGVNSETLFLRCVHEESCRPREDKTPKLKGQFNRALLQCEQVVKGHRPYPHLWNWLAMTLVRVEPVDSLREAAVHQAFAALREATRDRRSLQEKALAIVNRQH